MFSKNLRYFRLKKRLSLQELADQAGCTRMAISNYESGNRKPDMAMVKKLADILGVRVIDFIQTHGESLSFQHGEFRKTTSLKKNDIELIQADTEDYFGRLYTLVDVLGEGVLPEKPVFNSLFPDEDAEKNGLRLRQYLKIDETGPVGNLIQILENKGFLLCGLDVENSSFSGLNGTVEGRPYIVFNTNMNAERIRFTVAHELAHLMFKWPDTLEISEEEKKVNEIAGAFLFPQSDAIRELGPKRTGIFSRDIIMTCQEYGISTYALVKRARQAEIISEKLEKDFYIRAAKRGWKKNEPSRIEKEMPTILPSLVYRAVCESEISAQKGAELLKMSIHEFMNEYLPFGEVLYE